MQPITAADIRRLAPHARADVVEGLVAGSRYLAEAGITTPRRLRHALAQWAHETGGFARLEESLTYTTAARLRAVWPSRFKAMTEAEIGHYIRNPQALGNFVYSGRLGNGPASSGDGYRYRGRGLTQTTGRTNYAAVERATGLAAVADPDLIGRMPEALYAACVYWRQCGCNEAAAADDVEAVTRLINGGTIGLADRKVWLAKAEAIWPDEAALPDPVPLPVPRPAPRPEPPPPAEPAPPAPSERFGVRLLYLLLDALRKLFRRIRSDR